MATSIKQDHSSFSKCFVMGIVNVTPDSFSDGGQFLRPEDAARKVASLFEEGADFVDIGAESTRPGAIAVCPKEEWQRLEPVLKAILDKPCKEKISLDSRHPETMIQAAKAGVKVFNCVGKIPEREMLQEISRLSSGQASFIASHMHGQPLSMQINPLDHHMVIEEVFEFFRSSVLLLEESGFQRHKIFCDPGIGFGKTDQANIRLVNSISTWTTKFNIAVGVSRKSFISRVWGAMTLDSKESCSKIIETTLVSHGVKMIRTHNVSLLKQSLKIFHEACLA